MREVTPHTATITADSDDRSRVRIEIADRFAADIRTSAYEVRSELGFSVEQYTMDIVYALSGDGWRVVDWTREYADNSGDIVGAIVVQDLPPAGDR